LNLFAISVSGDTHSVKKSFMEKPMRVLVANHPRLMRDVIVATFAGQPGIEIVGEVSDDAEIVNQVHATLPDLVVIALDESGERPALCDRLLREHPQLRIMAVALNEDRTIYYWASLKIHCADIENSPTGILKAVHHPAPDSRHTV
jgi:chemotaxis response regulator CheB